MADPVKFNKPPVAEVVCGVLFNSLSALKTPHIGLFWNKVRTEFPRVEEAPPIDPVVEASGEAAPPIEVELSQLPPMRRSWLLNPDGTHLLQIQQDRFLFNWKRVAGSEYPSYSVLIEQFEAKLAAFHRFLADEQLGRCEYRQFELTYVNLIGEKNGLNVIGKSDLLVDHRRDASPSRFLPEPEKFSWNTGYRLPDGWGRLHMNVQTATLRQTNERVVRLELTARGVPPNLAALNLRKWFDLAHRWITFGFADSTNKALHSTWERES